MTYRWLVSVLISALLIQSGAVAAEDKSVSELFELANSRFTAIQTGSLRYQFGTCRPDPAQPKPWPWDPKEWSPVRKPVTLTLSGDEWVVRHSTGNTAMHRTAMDALYLQTDQSNGTSLKECRLTPPLDDMGTELERDFKFRVIRAGTIPTKRILDYLNRRLADARDSGQVKVEGDTARLLEWEVPAADFQELDLWFEWKSAKLRLYLLPDMGGAVRRLEYADPDGKWAARYESDNFRKVADAIWFPWNYYFIIDQTQRKNSYYVDQYIVEDVSGVNQPVPESVFDLEIPDGTRVLDARDTKKVVRFTAGAVTRLSQVDGSRDRNEPQPAPAPFSRNILILTNILVILLLCGVALARRIKSSKDLPR